MLESMEVRMHRDHDTVNRACVGLLPLKPLIINKNFGVVLEMGQTGLAFFRENPLHDFYLFPRFIPSKSY
jgi:hypothetical protein